MEMKWRCVAPGLGRIVEVVDDGYNPLLLGSALFVLHVNRFQANDLGIL